MCKTKNMTLAIITTKLPIAILFYKDAPSNDDIMEIFGNMILDKMKINDKPIDSYFHIERIPVEEDLMK